MSLFLLIGVRLIAYRILPPRVALLCATLTSATYLLALFGYYAVVVAGLESWGRVVSQELLVSYFWQLPDLLDALGVSPVLVFSAVVLVCGVAFISYGLILRKQDWGPQLAGVLTGWLPISLFLALLLWSGIRWTSYFSYASTDLREPFSLTFSIARHSAAAHPVRALDPQCDQREAAARLAYRTNPTAARKNIVVIVVDALRPDHMGLYGYARNTTPFLSELKSRDAVQTLAGMRSACAESACGLRSMFSARYVHQFCAKPITLHQVLKLHGYQINLILGGDHTNFYGLRNEYGEVDSIIDGSMAPGYYMNDDQYVIDKTRALPKWNGQPVMFQYHLMSAHQLGKRHVANLQYLPAEHYSKASATQASERFTNFYDNGVLQSDNVVKQLLSELESKGYLKDALVIVTADHGEALGEHGLFTHSHGVRDVVVRIPFVAMGFGRWERNEQVGNTGAVSQADIGPTILHELRLPIPETWRNPPIQKATRQDFVWFEQHPEYGILDQRDPHHSWKYILKIDTGEEYLFDLKADPEENLNVIGTFRLDRRKELRAMLHLPAQVGK